MRHSLLLQPVTAGVVAAFVGFASSFAVVLKGLSAVGASDAQAASGLMALAIAMGVAGIVLSVATRMPIAAAWSTPGAALLAATGATAGGFPEAVGAFLVVGLLFVAAGLIRPFGRLVAAIPPTLANAAKHKLVGLLAQRLRDDGVYVGEVMVAGMIKGSAWDSGASDAIKASTVADKFWELYRSRSETCARVAS